MFSDKDSGYRKNFSLIITFLALISIVFISSLFLAFNYSQKSIENEFVSEKISVLEKTIKPYNNFFLNKLPEISYYNGYLDSATSTKFITNILNKYPFVAKVIFYDIEIKNSRLKDNGLNVGDFSIGIKNVYQFGKKIPKSKVLLFTGQQGNTFTQNEDFNDLAVKIASFIQKLDTTKLPTQDQFFNTFCNIRPNKITYLNTPTLEDLKIYQKMVLGKLNPAPLYQQDMLSFQLDAAKLKIINTRPLLYQKISIVPLTYDPLETTTDDVKGEVTLGGAFADYKLYFVSSKAFIKKEILSFFLPIALLLLLCYAILVLVAFLIYRNLNINHKMFKLQYDFVNNLTHEFKTPVSVIKIAGNNIKSANSLTDKELKLYGKILDEEADKLNGLMNKLLAFTQIENKAIVLNKDEINIVDFIVSTIDVHQLKHPDFNFTYEVTGFTTFITDPVLLGSLFDNLAENAYKYSPANHKKLHLTARLIKEKIVFRFTDQGIGIPSSEISNIFKKFYRIQNQYNQNGSVGLGLAFCKELVNFMKGEISVKSRENKGSEFKIVLPYYN